MLWPGSLASSGPTTTTGAQRNLSGVSSRMSKPVRPLRCPHEGATEAASSHERDPVVNTLLEQIAQQQNHALSERISNGRFQAQYTPRARTGWTQRLRRRAHTA